MTRGKRSGKMGGMAESTSKETAMKIQCKAGSEHKTMTEVLLCNAGNPVVGCKPMLVAIIETTTDEVRRAQAAHWLGRL